MKAMKDRDNLYRKHTLSRAILLALIVPIGAVHATDVYLDIPAINSNILDFEAPLQLITTDTSNNGLTIAERRALMPLLNSGGSSLVFNGSDTDLYNLSSLPGSSSYYLYKYYDCTTTYTNLALGAGAGNNPLILDLGEDKLTATGNLQSQGAHYVTTVNSLASSGSLLMNGTGALMVNAATTGRIEAGELLESVNDVSASCKVLLDLNSTLKNGASFVFAEETAGTSGNSFTFTNTDDQNSNLYDNSYVINSSSARDASGNNESVVITFSRDNDEYIEKSFTRNHPSNDAALKLGTIAADGVALGDMQTALTLLDINDFGYGNNADNLAIQVKRLAPIANNSLMISSFDALDMVGEAVDYRFGARRGNWSGHSDEKATFWAKLHGEYTSSSGSVPVATSNAQDTAGHDGFSLQSAGVSMGVDQRYEQGLLGASLSTLSTAIRQKDDRSGEDATQRQLMGTLYGRWNNRYDFVAASYTLSHGDTEGERKTAIGRTANYTAPLDSYEFAIKAGHRFDLPDGRSALTPQEFFTGEHLAVCSCTEHPKADQFFSQLCTQRTGTEGGFYCQ